MIERVARAMSVSRYGTDANWRQFRDEARAAIEAMRHASDSVLQALWVHPESSAPTADGVPAEWYGTIDDLRAGFERMIDAALEETK